VPDRYRVAWAPVAISDAVSILEYLSEEDPGYAEQLLGKLQSQAQSLERFPARGRIVPELKAMGIQFLRELVIAPYCMIFRIEGHEVHVLAVFDGRRNLEDVLLERALRNP